MLRPTTLAVVLGLAAVGPMAIGTAFVLLRAPGREAVGVAAARAPGRGSSRPSHGGTREARTRGFDPGAAAATAEERAAVDPLTRAVSREDFLQARATATAQRTRAQALAAFRLARRRSADFLGDANRRVATARALDAALLVLRRSASETAGWRKELAHAETERRALQRADSRRAGTETEGAEAPRPLTPMMLALLGNLGPGAAAVFAPLGAEGIIWPTRGTLVSAPGLRRDPATGTEAIAEGIEILGRMNDPVRAVADGRVRLVVELPQGGYAVVTEHADDRISILSGLRQVDVARGAAIKGGDVLGLMGRDLDGAPVLGFELWQAGNPIDPRPLLPPDERR
jgi:murein DD-endopeptidase MepM/ murein hydrolase activator NlpD